MVAATIPDSLFFAIRPDKDAAARIAVCSAELSATCGLRGRPIVPERLHISLQFVGEFHPFLVVRAMEAGRSVRARPIEITLDRALSFSNRRKRHPFVLASTAPLPALTGLQEQLAMALRQAGLRGGKRSFAPHLTLLYDEQIVKERLVLPIRWMVHDFVLVRSFYGKSRHETLGRWPLASAC